MRCGALHRLAGDQEGVVRVCTKDRGHGGYCSGPKVGTEHVLRSPLDCPE